METSSGTGGMNDEHEGVGGKTHTHLGREGERGGIGGGGGVACVKELAVVEWGGGERRGGGGCVKELALVEREGGESKHGYRDRLTSGRRRNDRHAMNSLRRTIQYA